MPGGRGVASGVGRCGGGGTSICTGAGRPSEEGVTGGSNPATRRRGIFCGARVDGAVSGGRSNGSGDGRASAARTPDPGSGDGRPAITVDGGRGVPCTSTTRRTGFSR